MKKKINASDLKRIIKPIVEECIKETLLEGDIISKIIQESVKSAVAASAESTRILNESMIEAYQKSNTPSHDYRVDPLVTKYGSNENKADISVMTELHRERRRIKKIQETEKSKKMKNKLAESLGFDVFEGLEDQIVKDEQRAKNIERGIEVEQLPGADKWMQILERTSK